MKISVIYFLGLEYYTTGHEQKWCEDWNVMEPDQEWCEDRNVIEPNNNRSGVRNQIYNTFRIQPDQTNGMLNKLYNSLEGKIDQYKNVFSIVLYEN